MKKNEEVKDFINLAVLKDEQGRVLMVRRKEEETGNDGSVLRWAFPGGEQCLDETREECVKRKVLSKTGYNIESVKQIDLQTHPQFPVMIVYHLCRLLSLELADNPSESHEIAEMRWVNPNEIRGLITTALNPEVAKELGIQDDKLEDISTRNRKQRKNEKGSKIYKASSYFGGKDKKILN